MIKTFEQAFKIQTGRYQVGKKGVAKAVRRYLRRIDPENYISRREALLVSWPEANKGRAA